MTEQETRKKICEIIAPYVSAWGDDTAIANALIEAGIGDVNEWKHRTEVAERAFDLLKGYATRCWDFPCPVVDVERCRQYFGGEHNGKNCNDCPLLKEEIFKQAEQELARRTSDD